MYLILEELPLEDRSIREQQLPLPVLQPLVVLPLVPRSIGPGLDPASVLAVIFPLPFIARAVSVRVYAIAAGLVVDPVALEGVAGDEGELALAVCSILFSISVIPRAILPLLDALPIAKTILPFSILHLPL